jgi:hypothetical protein
MTREVVHPDCNHCRHPFHDSVCRQHWFRNGQGWTCTCQEWQPPKERRSHEQEARVRSDAT